MYKPRKIKIIMEDEAGEITLLETIPIKLEAKTFTKGKKNPDREILWGIQNHSHETMKIVHYRGNDYLNCFIDGGLHPMRFILNKENMKDLVFSIVLSTILKTELKIVRESESLSENV